MLSAKVIQMIPMVAAVPNDVPVKTETKAHRRKEKRIVNAGRQALVIWQMMKGIVPQARQEAVSIPIKMKVIRMVFMLKTEAKDSLSIFMGDCFFSRP